MVDEFSLSMFQKMLGHIWQYLYTSLLRYWLKWLIRQATGKCELQRICSGYEPGATRTTKIGELNNPWYKSVCFLFIMFKLTLTCFLYHIVEYSLRSSKSEVRECQKIIFYLHKKWHKIVYNLVLHYKDGHI